MGDISLDAMRAKFGRELASDATYVTLHQLSAVDFQGWLARDLMHILDVALRRRGIGLKHMNLDT